MEEIKYTVETRIGVSAIRLLKSIMHGVGVTILCTNIANFILFRLNLYRCGMKTMSCWIEVGDEGS